MKVLSGLLALLTSSQGQMLNEVTLPWKEHLLFQATNSQGLILMMLKVDKILMMM
jgi:hypothetical protein